MLLVLKSKYFYDSEVIRYEIRRFYDTYERYVLGGCT